MTTTLSYEELVPLAKGKDVPCPLCVDAELGNPKKPTLRVWLQGNFASYFCPRCDTKGWAHPEGVERPNPIELKKRLRKAEEAHQTELQRRIAKARWIWSQGKPAHGTVVPTYLARRGIKHPPDTLRFLSARGQHAPAMVAAFGLPGESLPGRYDILPSAAVQGVHITRLKPDGAGKAADDEGRMKIMIGPSMGWPIALVPVNDSGGLLLAEGIETALSYVHTGLGIWAAGSAGRLPALAHRIAHLTYVEAVTISADDDAHQQGQLKAEELAEKLHTLRPDIDISLVGGPCGS